LPFNSGRIEQRFCFLKVGHGESFCEPFVDRTYETAGVVPPTLVSPETGKIVGGAQFEEASVLCSGDG
jgi:hypothetical protein